MSSDNGKLSEVIAGVVQQVDFLSRLKRTNGGLDRRDCFLRARKAGLGVEVGRRHEKYAVDAGKRLRQTVGISDRCDCDLATLLGPRPTLVDVADDGLTGRPAASRVRATMPPTLPVIPVTAYMICLLPTIRKWWNMPRKQPEPGDGASIEEDCQPAYSANFVIRRLNRLSLFSSFALVGGLTATSRACESSLTGCDQDTATRPREIAFP
jgi:hypothetical protein